MSQYRTELANTASLARWVELRLKLWPHHTASAHERECVAMLQRPSDMVCIMAMAEGSEAIGFAEAALRRDYVAGCTTSPVGFLEGIFVLESWRRNGVARRLFSEIEDWARQRGCEEFGSDALTENVQSHRMHVALGFEEVERVVLFRKTILR